MFGESTSTQKETPATAGVSINEVLAAQDSIRQRAKNLIKHIERTCPASQETTEAILDIQSAVANCCTALMHNYNAQQRKD